MIITIEEIYEEMGWLPHHLFQEMRLEDNWYHAGLSKEEKSERQTGRTTFLIAKLVHRAVNIPGSKSAFFTWNFSNCSRASRMLCDVLMVMSGRALLKFPTIKNNTAHLVELSNGSAIEFFSVDNLVLHGYNYKREEVFFDPVINDVFRR